MISQTAEYALRAIVFLSEIAGGQTTEQIAVATKIPAAYLSKVLQLLSRASIVQSQRGLGGGYSLRVPPNKLTVLDVVNAVDPLERIRECPLKLDAHATKLCKLHRRLDDAAALIECAFGETKISDILTDPKSRKVYTFPPRGKGSKKTLSKKSKGR